MAENDEFNSLEYTPTWVVAVVCFVIVLMSLLAERGLHKLGKFVNVLLLSVFTCLGLMIHQYLKHTKQDALFEALQKLKAELMLLGFISLLLTVSQGLVTRICIPRHLATHMLPCKRKSVETTDYQMYWHRRRLLSASSNAAHCMHEGQVQLFSLEALHQLHIFVFVLAVVHVIFCATTMVLGGARIRQWKTWEDSIRQALKQEKGPTEQSHEHHLSFLEKHARGYWRKAAVVSWLRSFFKQFYGSITKSDYIALRQGFIRTHCPSMLDFDFHKYMLRTLEVDFKKIVGISWYLWLFVVMFLLLDIEGWHTYFWLAFLPLILLLLVGAKLEHVIVRLEQEVAEKRHDRETAGVQPSDKHFWFGRPGIVLYLIQFILFQNSFEIAFFFWILVTYSFRSCIMEKLGYIVTRLIIGLIVQVLCSYSTLPLYALVSQMGSKFKEGMFNEHVKSGFAVWLESRRPGTQLQRSATEPCPQSTQVQEMIEVEGRRAPSELSHWSATEIPSPPP